MENKGESLPSPISSSSSGKKSTRKEEQYRLMFSELEKYVVAHSSNSSKHYSVLECLMQVRRFISFIEIVSKLINLGSRCGTSRCPSREKWRAR